MQYSATSCIYLIGLYTKEKFTYTCFKNLDLANSFLTREFPDKGSACESRAFFYRHIICIATTYNASQSRHQRSDHPALLLSQN